MTIRALASAFLFGLACAGAALAQESAAVLDPKAPCPRPEYPRSSLVNEETGTVTLAFTLGDGGNVVDSKVVKSTGFKKLDHAAESAFAKCKFKQGLKTAKIDFTWAL